MPAFGWDEEPPMQLRGGTLRVHAREAVMAVRLSKSSRAAARGRGR